MAANGFNYGFNLTGLLVTLVRRETVLYQCLIVSLATT